jgi:hypothetical protein
VRRAGLFAQAAATGDARGHTEQLCVQMFFNLYIYYSQWVLARGGVICDILTKKNKQTNKH